MAGNVVRQIRIQGVSDGLKELERDTRAVGSAVEATARTTETSAKRQLSAAEAVRRLQMRMDEAFRSADQMARAQRDLDRALEQGVLQSQQQYNALLAQAKSRYDAATIAAQKDAQAAAALRAQINPLAAAQDRMNAELAEYSGLAARGVIGPQELAQAQAMLKARLDATTASLQRQNAAVNDNVAGNAASMNAMFQLQDIGMMAVSGQSPLMIAVQQGTQLSGALGPLGAAGAARALGSALLGLVSPVSLIAVGLTGLTAAAIQYFTSTDEEVDNANKALEAHGALISRLRDFYGEAAAGLQSYTRESAAILQADIQRAQESYLATVAEGAQAALDKITGMSARRIGTTTPLFADIQQAVDELAASIDAGDPKFQEFINTLAKLEVHPYVTDSQKEIIRTIRDLDTTAQGLQAERSLGGLSTLFTRTGEAADRSKEALNGYTQAMRELAAIAAPAMTDMDRANEAFREGMEAAGNDIITRMMLIVEHANTMQRIRDEMAGADVPILTPRPNDIEMWDEATEAVQRFQDQLSGTADNLIEKFFPGQAAYREAQELSNLLDKYGDQLDALQRKAVEMEIDRKFTAAALGVRDLGNATDRTGDKIDDLKDKARDFAEEFRETVGQALHDVFTGGIKDLEDFARAFSGLAASNMQSFVDWAMGMGQFAPAKAPASVPRAQIVSFGEIIGAKVGESVANVISDGPIWERVGRGGGVAAAIQTGQAVARGITPALNQTFDSHLQAVMAGIKKIESSGNYGAIGPAHSRYGSPLGAYQIMEANLPQWSKQALGRFVSAGEFLKDAAMQDMIASKQMTRLFERFGNWDDVISAWHSGRPLSEAGSARDSLGTFTRDYVQKVNAAMGEVPDAVKVGATSGTQEGTQKGFIKLGQEVANAQPSQGGAQGGGFGNTAFGLLGAGLGGFSMGFQSANPLMGALGGAMQGWGAGAAFGMPIIGAVVGAIGGLIGGLLGARKRLKEAQHQLEMQIDEINNLIAVGEGKGLGKLQRRLAEYLTEVDKAVDLAWKARDMDLVERLQRSFNIYWARLEKDFAAGFEGLMNAYRSGRGEDDPFMQGFRAVEKLREEIREMIADVRYFGESRIELNPPELYDELKARMDREMEAATAAAIAMAMSFLAGAEEMTGMEQNVLSLQGAAAGLRATLQELGVSAEDTGRIIEQQFNAAMLKLQSEHIAEVSASIYDLADMGFINDLIGAQEQYNERLRDATILGLSADLANQELALSLRAIVTEADLTKEQITQLAAAFPALSSQLLGLAGLVGTGDTAKALADAEERKVEAENDLRRAYEQQASELENTISRLESFTESIKQFRDSLRVDNNLSPLNPFGRLTEAQKQFRETAALAMGGDEEAMGRLEDVSREYLDEARGYYASSEAYFAIFEEVQRILDQSLVSAEGQLTEAEKQLEQLKKQVGTLIDIDDGVKSVADAINAFRAAEAAVNAAEIADNAYKNTLFQQMIALLAQQAAADAAAKAAADAARPVYATNDPIANAYRTYLGHEPDAAGYAFWAGNLASGMMSIDQIIAEFRRVGGFASGGYTGDLGLNQVAGVVHGQEFVMNAMATERWRPQFEAINRGSWPAMGDNSAVVAELRELRQENARLSTAVQKLSQVVALSDEETRNVLREGNATQAENASTLRKVASR